MILKPSPFGGGFFYLTRRSRGPLSQRERVRVRCCSPSLASPPDPLSSGEGELSNSPLLLVPGVTLRSPQAVLWHLGLRYAHPRLYSGTWGYATLTPGCTLAPFQGAYESYDMRLLLQHFTRYSCSGGARNIFLITHFFCQKTSKLPI